MAGLRDLFRAGGSGDDKKTNKLLARLARAKSGEDRKEAADALGEWGDPAAIEELIGALADEDSSASLGARFALQKMGHAALQPCIAALQAEDVGTRQNAVEVLGKLRDRAAVEPLMKLISDPSSWVRKNTVVALTEIGDRRAVPVLIEALQDDDMVVRNHAAKCLGKLGASEAIEPLAGRLDDESEVVRKYAAAALARIDGEAAVGVLISALRNEHPEVRSAAAEALGRTGDKRAIEALEAAQNDDDASVKNKARAALGKIQITIDELPSVASPDAESVDMVLGALKDGPTSVKRLAIKALRSIAGELADMDFRKKVSDRIAYWLKDNAWEMREAAAHALADVGEVGALPKLARSVTVDVEKSVQIASARALGSIDEQAASELLCQYASEFNRDQEERNIYKTNWFGACSALGEVGDPWVVPPLVEVLRNRDLDGSPAIAAAKSLGRLGDARALEPLIEMMERASDHARQYARQALRDITGEFHGDDVAAWRDCTATQSSRPGPR